MKGVFKHKGLQMFLSQMNNFHPPEVVGRAGKQELWFVSDCIRQTERYLIDRKKVITDLFVMEMREIHVYTRL